MSLSPRTVLTNAIETALATITKENGHHTNIGYRIFIGDHPVNNSEAPCCVLYVGDEVPSENAGLNAHVQIEYTIVAYVNRLETAIEENTDKPHAEHAIIDAIIKDVRDVIEGEGCMIDPASQSITYQRGTPKYHEEGGELSGAQLQYVIETPYIYYIPGQ